jgi:thiamine-monophosphate kinase
MAIDRQRRPMPRVALGVALRRRGLACIDLSDGLAQDAGHVARERGSPSTSTPVSFRSPVRSLWRIPMGVRGRGSPRAAVDYELLFTAPASRELALRD